MGSVAAAREAVRAGAAPAAARASTPRAAGSWMASVPSFALDVAGRMAPTSMRKTGVLTMDGLRRWTELKKGVLRVYADESASGAPLLEASLLYVEVTSHNATPATFHLAPISPCELRITVEPEALNRAIDRGRGSMPTPVGVGMCGGGMLNPHAATTEHSGGMARVTVCLFAESTAEKMAWASALSATAHGRRQWAHARHELNTAIAGVKDSMGRATGSSSSRASRP